MTGTLAQARIQLQNAESSILFMQQEHAKTLQGLYAEIGKLQKKCGELTFKLAMSDTSTSIDEGTCSNVIESRSRHPACPACFVAGDRCFSGQVSKEFSDVQKLLNDLKSENIELKGVIEVKSNRIVVLEGQLSTLEQNYSKDLEDKEVHLASVRRELEKKSDTVAYLTSQLHHSKLKLSGRHHEDRSSIDRKKREVHIETQEKKGESTVSNHNSEIEIQRVKTPVPPRGGTPSNVRRPFRRSVTSPAVEEVESSSKPKSSRAVGIQVSPNEIQLNVAAAKASKGMPSRPRRGASPPRPGLGISKGLQRSAGRDRPSPGEYVEFLKTGNRPEPQIVVRTAPEPLPPISSSERLAGTPKSPYTGKVQMSQGHSSQRVPATIYTVGHDSDGPVSVEDVGKIIVSPLSSPEKGWRHRQQPRQQNGPD